MLLPDSFGPGPPPEAFLAWDTAAKALAGAAVFHRLRRETVRLQAITVRPYRRRGIGSALLGRVCERAVERGDTSVWSRADLEKVPEAAEFLMAGGFKPAPALLRIEGDVEPIRKAAAGLYDGLVARGKIPAGVRALHTSEFQAGFLLKLYRDLIAPAVGTPAEAAVWAISQPEFEGFVLIHGDHPAGILVGKPNDGHGLGLVHALAVSSEYRGGWANVLLLHAAADWFRASGARRFRFETLESNREMRRHLERARGIVTARLVDFCRELDVQSGSGADPD